MADSNKNWVPVRLRLLTSSSIMSKWLNQMSTGQSLFLHRWNLAMSNENSSN